eukprot:1147659-Pelagomonas_calceolata.AAC.4
MLLCFGRSLCCTIEPASAVHPGGVLAHGCLRTRALGWSRPSSGVCHASADHSVGDACVAIAHH